MSIFGAAFDVSTDRWVAFNERTLASLSEHDTLAEAQEACRRYAEREIAMCQHPSLFVSSYDLTRNNDHRIPIDPQAASIASPH
jgi:hypothetical protein